jgi:hypothetical protein
MKPTKKEAKQLKERELAALRAKIQPGDEIDCILRSVSASGMTRHISLYHKGINITFEAACILEENPYNEWRGHRAIKVGGCGMDMGFETVYRLGRRLFPDGFKPSDAGRSYGRNGTSADQVDTDGGYALTHRWF